MLRVTHCILKTPKWVLFQTVQTQMKCNIILNFISVCTVCQVLQQSSGTEIRHNLETKIPVTL